MQRMISGWEAVSGLKHFDEPAYASKGIAEAMIPVIASFLNKNVKSSSGTDLGSGHYRMPRATAYWKRTPGATYDEATDVFTYPRPAQEKASAGESPLSSEITKPDVETNNNMKSEAGTENAE